MSQPVAIEQVISGFDERELADLTLALGKINSPPGEEAEISEFVFEWFARQGIEAQRQEVLPGRFNVIARLADRGGGQSLILNSHFDTAYGDPMDIWTAGRLNEADISAWEEEDRIFGQGVVNDKAPMAATMMVLKGLKDAEIRLAGDLVFTGVAGEIGRAPIDEYQGPRYQGKGIGTRYAVSHGVVADHALVAECTNWTCTEVECGCLFVKVSVYGKAIYTPFLSRPENPANHPNAIVQAARLIEALESWAQDYQSRHTRRFRAGLVEPKASVGAIRGGLPYKPIETAGICALYLDVRIPPGLSPVDPIEEIRQLIHDSGVCAEVQPYLFRRGYEGQGVETLRHAITQCHRQFFKADLTEPEAPVSSMWRDLNVFNEVGIPAVTYGPPLGLNPDGWTYFILKKDILRAAQIYTWIAHDICNRPRNKP